jgi:hypothetical protein
VLRSLDGNDSVVIQSLAPAQIGRQDISII